MELSKNMVTYLKLKWKRSWISTVLMRDKLKMDGVLLCCVYTHSKNTDTYKDNLLSC